MAGIQIALGMSNKSGTPYLRSQWEALLYLQVSGERVRLFGLDAPEKMQSCTDRVGRPYACGEHDVTTGTEMVHAWFSLLATRSQSLDV